MVMARLNKRSAEVLSALLALIELPLTILWFIPGLFIRENPLTVVLLNRPNTWLYARFVEGDIRGWPDQH
jgi:hypothetical protein